MVNSCSGDMVDVEVDLRVSFARKYQSRVVLRSRFYRELDRGTWKSR
jgi:hypothetical protein